MYAKNILPRQSVSVLGQFQFLMVLKSRKIGQNQCWFIEIIAVFQMKKSQIDTKKDENPKVFQFSKFISIFRLSFGTLFGSER